VPIAPDSKVHLAPKSDPLCIHLNGYIDHLNRHTIWDSFKLTDTSYATASLEKSEWAVLFRQDIRFARSVFFVGYSLFDLDIKRILRATADLTEKTFFILYDKVDLVTEARAARYGHVLKIGTVGLADAIENGGYATRPTPTTLRIGRSIVEYEPPTHVRSPSDREFLDLIMLGEFNPALPPTDVGTRNLYNCERTLTTELVKRLDAGQVRLAALHSEIANGKTISLALIAKAAAARGWRVFCASELTEHAEREFLSVAELPGKILVLVDDYGDWLSELKGITSIAGDRFAMVVTARSNSHDFAVDELEQALSQLPFEEQDLTTLNDDELHWWVETLDTYGLWGTIAGESKERKTRFLADDCDRQIQGILLKLFDSPVIRDRLTEAASAIREEPQAEKIAITTFALIILNQRPTVDTITDFWGVDAFTRESVQRNEGIGSFIDISRSSVRVRSTAAAEYLLNHFWQADEVVSVLLEIASAADRFYRISIKYEQLFRTMMRFSSIQSILPEKGRRDAVIYYYENLKRIDRCKRYPLFWLQYAIGALVIGDLMRASRYFETAYSLAEERRWDTFQIDNHYARYLLVRAATEAPFDEAMELFRQARTLINRQIKDERLHYPFRVASTYQDFFDRFQSQFSDGELNEISQAAETVAERIEQLPSDRASNKYVRRCEQAMIYTRESIAARLSRN
jgi:uncharacterized protein YktA (UPF0223 family)